jgi:hypothetical protein
MKEAKLLINSECCPIVSKKGEDILSLCIQTILLTAGVLLSNLPADYSCRLSVDSG